MVPISRTTTASPPLLPLALARPLCSCPHPQPRHFQPESMTTSCILERWFTSCWVSSGDVRTCQIYCHPEFAAAQPAGHMKCVRTAATMQPGVPPRHPPRGPAFVPFFWKNLECNHRTGGKTSEREAEESEWQTHLCPWIRCLYARKWRWQGLLGKKQSDPQDGLHQKGCPHCCSACLMAVSPAHKIHLLIQLFAISLVIGCLPWIPVKKEQRPEGHQHPRTLVSGRSEKLLDPLLAKTGPPHLDSCSLRKHRRPCVVLAVIGPRLVGLELHHNSWRESRGTGAPGEVVGEVAAWGGQRGG
ncbi:uncharacterized protein LOC102492645 isoform X2 [Tupaia chinensis]|uniref:uncharacterized protein LOC102492645 isoform X2 n=1 Tax=Tupaia chinensis TaxID=246437 RepID=UPI0003C8C898|nr:uncharacterized protein LOC102492645 isoform X2 [Tupaia chinensis]